MTEDDPQYFCPKIRTVEADLLKVVCPRVSWHDEVPAVVAVGVQLEACLLVVVYQVGGAVFACTAPAQDV